MVLEWRHRGAKSSKEKELAAVEESIFVIGGLSNVVLEMGLLLKVSRALNNTRGICTLYH